jgi:hypothetical protein
MRKCSQCGAGTEESPVDGVPKCTKCSDSNELAARKGSESHKAETKIIGDTTEIVGT